MASCFQHINECLYVVKSQLRSHWAEKARVILLAYLQHLRRVNLMAESEQAFVVAPRVDADVFRLFEFLAGNVEVHSLEAGT